MNKPKHIGMGLASIACVALLAGCGLADVGASAAAEGKSAAEQAKRGKELEAKVQKQLDDAQKAEANARASAEQASQ